jgi:hypothetical protein
MKLSPVELSEGGGDCLGGLCLAFCELFFLICLMEIWGGHYLDLAQVFTIFIYHDDLFISDAPFPPLLFLFISDAAIAGQLQLGGL